MKQNYQIIYKYILNSLKLLNLSCLLRMAVVLLTTKTGLKTEFLTLVCDKKTFINDVSSI